MHGLAIAQEIVEKAEKKGKVSAIAVEVCELAAITAEELRETLKGLVNWKVTVTEKQAVVECECGYRGRPKITERMHDLVLFECPRCEDVPKVIEGKEIRLAKVD